MATRSRWSRRYPQFGSYDGVAADIAGLLFAAVLSGGCTEKPDDGDSNSMGGNGGVSANAGVGGWNESGASMGEPTSAGTGAGKSGTASDCLPDMVPVGPSVCMDQYEASRQDATPTSAGTDERVATSRAGVLPWYVNPMTASAVATFEAACQAGGKRLCTADEWFESCRGSAQTTYFFGDSWDPTICNSVDTYCQQCCDFLNLESCPTTENCGYETALSSAPYTPETCSLTEPYSLDACHVCFHVMPTGALPSCTNEFGLYDVNGNVWEVVPVAPTIDSRGYQVRGGAFNCGSPSVRFQCDFNATWSEMNAGFRCCKDR